MKIVKTAKLKILTHTKTFDETIEIYNSALSFYISICEEENNNLKNKNSKEKINYIESLTHKTVKNREIKYDFDKDFYKFPSYLRRAVIMEAIGVVNSHFSRVKNWEEQNPTLIKKGKKYFLHISYETKVKLSSTPLKKQRVIGVDLGLTNSAVCSCIDYNGTVLDRVFINQFKEKDQLSHRVNKLSKAKRKSGIFNEKPNHWRIINNLQKFIVQDTVDKIINFAVKNKADIIVFEYLGKMKLPKNSYGTKRLRAKLQFWAKLKIQQKVGEKAHSFEIRYSRVLARGTSMYAYDGSGLLERNYKKDIATFSNGKKYYCDLSASYNIGSRYFTRAILKPLSEKSRLQFEAKIPQLVDRASHSLSSLIKLREVA